MGNIRCEVSDQGIATLWIDNPTRRNAITLEMWDHIAKNASDLSKDQSIRLVVLRGAGGQAFSGGADLGEFMAFRSETADVTHYNQRIEAAARAIETLEMPTLAVIDGPCFGAAVALACSCDLRIGNTGSRFAIPAAKLGIAYPPEWVALITRKVGPVAASYLLLTAQDIDGDAALRYGLLSEVLLPEPLETRLSSLSEMISELAPLSLKAAKAAIVATSIPDAWARAIELADLCDGSSDYQAGITAISKKEKPIFSGN